MTPNCARWIELFVVLAGTSRAASAQCVDFAGGFGAVGVVGSQSVTANVAAQAAFDDGNGPALYVGGFFEAAGRVAAECIAKWNGQSWQSIGNAAAIGSTAPNVAAFAVYDSGAGAQLYAGGTFNALSGVNIRNIARWNGTSWSPLAQGLAFPVRALIVFDDGSGAKLYAACGGTQNGGGGFNSTLAVWNGTSWTDISPSLNATIDALEIFDDGGGGGPQLYAGGNSILIGSTSYSLIKWNGSSWLDVGGGVTFGSNHGFVNALKSYDDGSGPALYVGGTFTLAGASTAVSNVARWNGTAWSPVGTGTNGAVRAFASFDDGSSVALYATGAFSTAGGASANRIARWKNGAWSALAGGGLAPGDVPALAAGQSFAPFDDGSGPALFVGGSFEIAGALRADGIARWQASGWSALGVQQGLSNAVDALGSYDLGAGLQVVAGGSFSFAGPVSSGRLAQWNGSAWSSVGSPTYLGSFSAFATFDDGSGEKFYAGGAFVSIGGVAARSIASWDGTHWSALGSGADFGVNALATFDDGSGPALWAGGDFTSMGGVPAKRVARWNGSSWSTPAQGPGNQVRALAAHDDGSGPALYVAGDFQKVGALNVFGIARWNGTSWSAVGNGFDAPVFALAVFDDGAGAQLYAAGGFHTAPPTSTAHIARWDGNAWQPLGLGIDQLASALEVFDDGFGPALYVGGVFAHAGGAPSANLARWSGASWSPVAGGVNGWVSALHAVESPNGAALWIGGSMTTAGAAGSAYIAKLERRCPCPPRSYCTAGTSSNGCVPTMSAVGSPSASGASSFVVTAANVEGQKLGLIFYGLSGANSSPWGATSSYLCVKAPTQRTTQSNSGGTSGACDGALVLDWNAYMNAHPSALGQPFQAGNLVWLQGWYRDPPSTKTTALTDALSCVVCP